jgi:hypothetical protein
VGLGSEAAVALGFAQTARNLRTEIEEGVHSVLYRSVLEFVHSALFLDMERRREELIPDPKPQANCPWCVRAKVSATMQVGEYRRTLTKSEMMDPQQVHAGVFLADRSYK